MKRFFKYTLCFLLTAFIITSTTVTSLAQVETKSQNAILVDQLSGNVMWSHNAYEKAYPASTTKLMTAIVYYEKFKGNLGGYVTVGKELDTLPRGSSIMGLEKEETVTREQLLYGLMLVSGNDAAIVMAQDYSGSMEGFASAMNAKAKEFGMESTHFVNSHGFHDPEHYTTAADFSILAREYMKYDELREIAGASKYDMAATNKKEAYTMLNSNRLISAKPEYKSFVYEKATGLKTGFTTKAKNCFTASASNGYTGLIFIGFGYETTEDRFIEAKKIMEYGFNNFSPINVYENIKDARVFADASIMNIPQYEYGHIDSMVQINAKETVSVDNSALGSIGAGNITAKFRPALNVAYPINEGDFIGYVEYYSNNTVIYTAKAYATQYISDRKLPGFVNTARLNASKGFGKGSFMEQAVNLGMEMKDGDAKINLDVDKDKTSTDSDKSTQTGTSSSNSTTVTTKPATTGSSTKLGSSTKASTKSGAVTTKKATSKKTTTTTKKAS